MLKQSAHQKMLQAVDSQAKDQIQPMGIRLSLLPTPQHSTLNVQGQVAEITTQDCQPHRTLAGQQERSASLWLSMQMSLSSPTSET